MENVADWRLTVPAGVGLTRGKLTRADAEVTGLDVVYTTQEPKGGSVGVAVRPLPHDPRGLEAGPVLGPGLGRAAGYAGDDTFKIIIF